MKFNREQLVAITLLGTAIAQADEKLEDSVVDFMFSYFLGFRLSISEVNNIAKDASELSAPEAVFVVDEMSRDQKEDVSIFLDAVVIAKGKYKKNVLEVRRNISSMCNLPNTSEQKAKELYDWYK